MKPTKNTPPENPKEARRLERKRRRRRRQIFRTAVVLSALLVLALVITLLVLRGIGIAASKNKETTSFLAVKAIEVEGETRYSDEQLIETSGIYVGQSLLAVNKVQSHDALMKAHPYLSRVEIRNSAFDTVCITVEETKVMGAVKSAGSWYILGENNHALERVKEKDLPKSILRIRGATPESTEIGGILLDERSLSVCNTLLKAAQSSGLEGMSTIDITEKTNVQFWWKEQVQVVLGNESNMTTQVAAFADLLPTLLKNNGDTVTGRVDMTSYADDDSTNDRAIYTPTELLEVLNTPITTTTTGGTTTTGTGTATTTTAAG